MTYYERLNRLQCSNNNISVPMDVNRKPLHTLRPLVLPLWPFLLDNQDNYKFRSFDKNEVISKMTKSNCFIEKRDLNNGFSLCYFYDLKIQEKRE